MAEDTSYQPGVYRDQGGNKLTVGAAGAIELESGAEFIVGDNDIAAELALLDTLEGELALLTGLTAGTVTASKVVTVDASKNVATFGTVGCGAITSTGASQVASLTATSTIAAQGDVTAADGVAVLFDTAKNGAAADELLMRFGLSGEGLELRVIDESITWSDATSFQLSQDIPADSVILSVQGNVETTFTSSGDGDRVAVGVSGDLDKYGETGTYAQNQKLNNFPTWAHLTSAEDVVISVVNDANGTVSSGNATAGVFRVKIVFYECNSLSDAA